MDKARGGRFQRAQTQYPRGAWYTYDDSTCDYECMAVEYFYWGLTSILGAQKHRYEDIGNEWGPVTRTLVMQKDQAAYRLFTDPQYNLPTVLPNGNYKGFPKPACQQRPTG